MALCRNANCLSCQRRRRNSLWALPGAAYPPPPASRERHSMEPVRGHVSALLPGGALLAIDAEAAGELGLETDELLCPEDIPNLAVGARVLFHVVKEGGEWLGEEVTLAPTRDRSRSPLRARENTERPLSR